jgi:hypothetical protein
VSFLDSQGHQIGPPATEGTAVGRRLVTLTAGSDGYATLDVTDPGIPACAGPGTVASIRVYPPAGYTSAGVAPPGRYAGLRLAQHRELHRLHRRATDGCTQARLPRVSRDQ